MNGYIFSLKKIVSNLRFTVFAATPENAVDLANQAFKENQSLMFGSGLVKPDFHSAEWMTKLNEDLVEAMIIGEVPLPSDDLITASQILKEAGYEYKGDDEMLGAEDTPVFNKVMLTDNRGGANASLQVRAVFDTEVGVYNFRIEGTLYSGESADLERGEAVYAIDFRDRQDFVTVTDLPQTVRNYERKFTELIEILLLADSHGKKQIKLK